MTKPNTFRHNQHCQRRFAPTAVRLPRNTVRLPAGISVHLHRNPHPGADLRTAAQKPADFDKIVHENEVSVMKEPDAEAWYHVGALMAACGQKGPALRLLKAAVQQILCILSPSWMTRC